MRHLPVTKLIVAGVALSAIGIAAATDLTPDQVEHRVAAAGYTNVQIVRREGNHFDVMATKDGRRMSLSVDASTGAIAPGKARKDEAHEHK